ncbi:MAG: exopolysaccharide Pel transporter PelG [Pikeienuella sp.]
MSDAAEIGGLLSRAAGLGAWLADGRILGPLLRVLGAVVVTAGPWLVFVIGLGIISISMQPVLGRVGIENLRLTVVYAFLIAPFVAGPVGVVAAALIRDQIEGDGERAVFETFVIAAVVSGVICQILAILLCFALGIGPYGVAIAYVFLSVAGALLWICFAVLGALRANVFLIFAFSCGMVVSVLCNRAAATASPTNETMIWGFTSGIVACIALVMVYMRRLCGFDPRRLAAAARALAAGLRRRWRLALGVLFALSGVWMDKWVLWLGPEGLKTTAGFLHYSAYDTVMFIAHLSIIPVFAAMMIFHEITLTRAIGAYRQTLAEGANYALLREAVERFGRTVLAGMLRISFIQAAVTTALVLMAPIIAQMINFGYAQFFMLRYGLVAIFFYSIIYINCSVLLICGRQRLFLLVQLSFLVLNLVSSIVLHRLIGVSVYPILGSAAVMCLASFAFAVQALWRYDYLMFLGENEQLYAPPDR